MNKHNWMITMSAFMVILAAGAWLAPAGSLTPPVGPLSSTMKDLDTVEPRIPIGAGDFPALINTPGSYYLTENVFTAGGGITIDCNDVTIDLMGFRLRGGLGAGITVLGSRSNIAIKNGVIRSWDNDGISAFDDTNIELEGLLLFNNVGSGADIGDGATITNCTAKDNLGSGIYTREGCVVTDCVAENNYGTAGIRVGIGSTVSRCSAQANKGHGIVGRIACTVIDCTARENGDRGISTNGNSMIRRCTVSGNTNHGIKMAGSCVVAKNTVTGTGLAGNVGIESNNAYSRVEANHVSNCETGFLLISTANLVIRNTVWNCATPYNLPAGTHYGQIIVAPGADFVNSNPWANFEF